MSDELVPAERRQVVEHRTETADAAQWRLYASITATLSATDFVPKDYRGKREAIMACLAYGHELGIGPMQSLQSIDVIQGKPTLKPEMMRSLIRRAGHSLVRVEATDDHCTFHGKRGDNGDEETVTYAIEDARRLGLTSKDNWKKQPRAMLTARCTAEIARSLFSDVLLGVSYTPDEMGDVDQADDEDYVDARTRVLRDVPDGAEGDDELYEQMEREGVLRLDAAKLDGTEPFA